MTFAKSTFMEEKMRNNEILENLTVLCLMKYYTMKAYTILAGKYPGSPTLARLLLWAAAGEKTHAELICRAANSRTTTSIHCLADMELGDRILRSMEELLKTVNEEELDLGGILSTCSRLERTLADFLSKNADLFRGLPYGKLFKMIMQADREHAVAFENSRVVLPASRPCGVTPPVKFPGHRSTGHCPPIRVRPSAHAVVSRVAGGRPLD